MLVLYIVWGTTYLGIRVVIETIPPFLMAAFRFTLAGGILLAFVMVRTRSLPRLTLRQAIDSALVGTGFLAIGNAFVGVGELTVPTGIAAVLIAMLPAWIAFFGAVLFRDRLPRAVLAGIVIGIVGVAILAWPTGVHDLDPFGLGVLILSPVGWSLASLYATRLATLPAPPLAATGWQMVLGGVVAGLVAFPTGEVGRFDPAGVSVNSLVAFAYLTIVGSLLAFSTYGWLMRSAPLSLVTTYSYVNPVVAVILGAIVLAEPITPRTLLAATIIVVAVALIVTAKGRLPGPREARIRVPATSPEAASAPASGAAGPVSSSGGDRAPSQPAPSPSR
jgi:drug/metabolite transporter (DMT)-like permease